MALSLVWSASAPVRASEPWRPVAPGEFQVATWGIAEGLPQGTITGVAEDAEGELWLATFGGLVSFDGARFRVYDLATLEGLPSNRFTAIAADPGGGLWLATQTGFAVHFAGGRIREVVDVSGRRSELVALVVSTSGEVFARTNQGVIFRIAGDKAERVLETGGGVGFRTAVAAPGGEVWASSRDAIHRISDGARFEVPGSPMALSPDGLGGLWIGLEDGLARFNAGTARRVEVVPPLLGPVTAIEPLDEKRIWVASRTAVLELEAQSDGSWREIAAPVELSAGMQIRAMHQDASGILWLGSNGDGLSRVVRGPFSRFRPPGDVSIVTALAPDGAGGAWIASSCAGLSHALAGGEVVPVALPEDPVDYPGCEFALALDGRKRLWVRARSRLFRVDEPAAKSAPAMKRISVGLPDEPGTVAADPDGSLWIGSRQGRVDRLTVGGELELVAELGTEIISTALDPEGGLWAGGWGTLFRVRSGNVERYDEAQGIPRGALRAILPRPGGTVLVGTYGGGLSLLDRGRARRITTGQGLLDNSISGLLADSRSRIWILSNRGISMVENGDLAAVAEGERQHLAPVDFGPERGVSEGNYGAPAVFGENDHLWFGTVAGALSIDAASIPGSSVPASVFVESLWFDDVEGPLAPRVDVPAGTGRVRFEFTTQARRAPNRVHFRHRIEGVDPDWLDIGSRRTVSFTPARPGEYLFQVEARNEDGVWSEKPAEIEIVVLPAWWQRRDTRAVGLVLLAGALWGAHRLRMNAIERRNRVLLREIEDRQRAEVEAARLRGEIEHVTRLATAGELATSLAHEVNQPLSAIVSNAQAGRRFLAQGEAARDEVEQIFGDIARQGQRASEVIQRLREFLRKETPQRASLDLNELVREVLPLLRREIEDREVRLEMDLAPLPRITGERVQLQQVVVNLIQNACEAMQHSPPPRQLVLRSRASERGVELTLWDSGPGVAPGMEAKIFEPFVSTKTAGMGVGLSICRSLVEGHGGTLILEEAAEGGARFCLRLPLEELVERSN